jgi:hypothetical protein
VKKVQRNTAVMLKRGQPYDGASARIFLPAAAGQDRVVLGSAFAARLRGKQAE